MIKKIDNIILLGTSHVAKQSVNEIKKVYEDFDIKVVGIELDIDRFNSLMDKNNKKNNKKKFNFKLIKEFGVSGYLFALLAGMIQKKVGKSLGIEAGSDMKTAYLEARKKKIAISLMDINIKITLKKLSKISLRKKISMFSKLFFTGFKKEYREKLDFDIKKGVPDYETIKNMMDIMKKEIPDLYRILIDDRNKHMSERLVELTEKHEGYILAVVGAGHLEGMETYIRNKIKNKRKNYDFSFTFTQDLIS